MSRRTPAQEEADVEKSELTELGATVSHPAECNPRPRNLHEQEKMLFTRKTIRAGLLLTTEHNTAQSKIYSPVFRCTKYAFFNMIDFSLTVNFSYISRFQNNYLQLKTSQSKCTIEAKRQRQLGYLSQL